MESAEKNIVYAFAAACILGIVIVGALVLTSHTTEEGFSELYFKEPTTIPLVVKIGDEIDFAFTTVSHEKKRTTYDYRVTYDGHDIRSGSFSCEPSSSKMINESITPKNSSLVKMKDPVESIYKMKKKKKKKKRGGGGGEMDVNMPGKFILPIRLQIMDSVGLLIFDPKLKESYNTSSRSVIPEGGQEDTAQSLSKLGYTIRHDDWNIVNDRGKIDILHKNSSTVYRYALKKVSVTVSSTGSEIRGAEESAKPAVNETRTDFEYEIHFWIMVKEDPDKLQNLW